MRVNVNLGEYVALANSGLDQILGRSAAAASRLMCLAPWGFDFLAFFSLIVTYFMMQPYLKVLHYSLK